MGKRDGPGTGVDEGSEPTASGVTIDALRTADELRGCVELQRRIWGAEFSDVVPASLLQVTQKVGGVAAGAFAAGRRLVGFVYGLTGLREGRPAHWSHMLAVVPERRSQGIGLRLKSYQRSRVRAIGVEEIFWTFDPLITGNAHFNLNLLGVEIDSYEADMYGNTGSDLHSLGTDRFIARWDVSGEGGTVGAGAEVPVREEVGLEGVPLANAVPGAEDRAGCDPAEAEVTRVRIEIPEDALRIHREDPELARAWRRSTRDAFLTCFREGYRVVGFKRLPEAGRAAYLLERPGGAGV
ncbi:MAG: GNAT family N-acetyltransferase [Gemmatimonadetes bacterium]|nr:GNAT family N-acetyltransferase [Gemmatimonadota bacterium]NIR78745.1 GNAT family N-acetyltransferase [Gemmatimonadota bacterium]NIT87384.1 GNAT family N-acetyltransferase [Gemmatimonadota bacterium]NIU31234.1 GNAT family N-acetyltransferase [Gemmatimonadota bacterium]NIU35946.1 GNAT family N-acetyltransferase [Gemmatimonadota bacterium]